MSTVVWLACAAAVVVIGGVAAYGTLVRRESRPEKVLCLMYHRLCDDERYAALSGTERVFNMPAARFDAQIGWLAAAGYQFVSADQVAAFASGELKLDGPAVMITFDDGCTSVATHAAPILRRHGARATVFVTTDADAYVFGLTPNDARLSDQAIADLDGDTILIESHSVTHRPLSELGDDDVCNELHESRSRLAQILRRPVSYFAVPGNWYDGRVLRLARQAGYRAVWSSDPGSVRRGATPFPFPRVNIDGDLSLAQFRAQLTATGIAQRRIVAAFKRLPGRLLGPRRWYPLRKAILRMVPGGHLSKRRVWGGLIVVSLVLMTVIILLVMVAVS